MTEGPKMNVLLENSTDKLARGKIVRKFQSAKMTSNL